MKKEKGEKINISKKITTVTHSKNKHAEGKEITSEENFRNLLANIEEGYFEVDLEGKITFLNESVCKVLGYSKTELLGNDSRKFTDKEDVEKVSQAYKTVYKTQSPIKNFNWYITRKDKSKRYIEGTISLRKDLSGKPIGFRVIANDFTERKKMEESLQRSEKKYRSILENIQEGYFEVDLTGKFTFFNDSICKILGYSREELTGMNNRHYTDEEISKEVFNAYNEVYRTGNPISEYGWMIKRKDGAKRYIEGSISLRKDFSGKPIGFRGIVHDITERKQVEENLSQSEEKYRTILENIEEGYYEVDLTGNFIFFNDAVCLILGYSREELLGMNNRQFTDKEHSDKLFKAFNKVFSTGEPSKGFDWQIIRKDGTRRYIEASVSLKKDSSNKPIGFRGIIHDITERKQIEEKLLDEEQRFRAFAEQSSDIILLVDKKGIITYVNPAVRVLGINDEKRIGTDVFERVHPEDLKLVSDSFNELFSDAKAPIKKAEVRVRHLNGDWFTFEVIGSNLVRNNVVEAAIVNLRDITERKTAEDKLQKTLENLRKSYGITIKVLIAAVEMRDPYTAGHQSRSADIARVIAREMGLPNEKIDGIRMAGSIHDIGKLSVPSEILSRPTKLTNIEFSMIKEHAQSGYEMLKNVESPWPLAEIVYQHHERMDGSGYPRNLKGDEIILEARIMAVSDVVEAMSSHRPYRASLGIEAALEEIEKNKGILYDKDVVVACLRLFREKGYTLIKIQ